MYGNPEYSGFGPEKIDSLSSLIVSLKRRQLLKPRGRFKLTVQGKRIRVNLLPTELIEFDGEVLALAAERQMDSELGNAQGFLDDDIDEARQCITA